MPSDSIATLTAAELEAHLGAGRKLLNAKRAEASGSATMRAAQAEIATLTAAAPGSQAAAMRPVATAAPVSGPPRPAWTSAQTDERVRKIVQSHWADGRQALAVQLCASALSIEEAIGALKASAADTATSGPDMAAEIFARRRGEVLAAQSAASTQLDPNEIFARRRAAAAANRQVSTGAPAAPLCDAPTATPALNASAIYAARRAARRQA